jgi:Ni2+-binding GTPase involved in maturation of urease and hydrogenase
MIFITVAGAPSCGKTSVILRMLSLAKKHGNAVGVVKFDCFSFTDKEIYVKSGIPAIAGLSGNTCPDHFFVSNIEDCIGWGERNHLDLLVSESAGLCNRCSPYIKDVLSVCVVDVLSGIDTPRKIGPMLKLADVVVVTKGDIVSQAEREVFLYRVLQVNARAMILQINGINGQGISDLYDYCLKAPVFKGVSGQMLRFSMPAAVCSYCLGQTKIGVEYQKGVVRRMEIDK